MKKWMPLRGNFIENNGSIVFQGIPHPQQLSDVGEPLGFPSQNISNNGIILFNDIILNGFIETNVKFENFAQGDIAQIIFNYQNENYFLCAGIANYMAKYAVNFINGQQNPTLCTAGIVDNLPTSEFNIKLQLSGSFLELYINSIKVLVYTISFMRNCTQVGVWVRSNSKVTISNFKTNYKQPEAFIVSQFGDFYDILYDEVIKPVCEKLNYTPIRADKVASSTLILNDIVESICNSALIIADITPNNPNVFYEVGYAHALNKPTILLCENGIRSSLPFDVSGFRTIFYDNSIGGKSQIEEKLKKYIQSIQSKFL